MKKVEAHKIDALSDYALVESEPAVAGPGEVLIKVAACGIGYVDALYALGHYQVKPRLPLVPGSEAAGWIESVGEGVSGFVPGDRVLGMVRGGFAEYAIAAVGDVTCIPAGLDFVSAAGFRVNYVTALHGLRDRGALQPGEAVLVIGAAGGVGSAAIQVAKMLGGYVVAAASSEEKRSFCTSLGADAVIDNEGDGWRDRLKAALGGRPLAVIFDPVCGPLFEPAFRSLGWGGRHLVVGFAGGPIPALPVNLPLMKGAALIGVDLRQFGEYESERAGTELAELLVAAGDGRLVPPIGRVFAFEDFGPALEHALSGRGLGKTVLRIG